MIPQPGSLKGYNRYAYVNNNPVNLTDPSGNKACEEIDKNGKCIVDADWKGNKNGEFSGKLAFSTLPIDDVTWVGFYGGTNFAYQDHKAYEIDPLKSYNYDGYCQGYHCGIDLGGNWGDPVYAGIYGTALNWGTGGGNWITILTSDGYIIKFQHLSKINITQFGEGSGQVINPGTIIGEVGNPTNDVATYNYHIHIEVRYNGGAKATNPLLFFSKRDQEFLYKLALSNPSSSNTYPSFVGQNPFNQPDIIIGGPVLWDD